MMLLVALVTCVRWRGCDAAIAGVYGVVVGCIGGRGVLLCGVSLLVVLFVYMLLLWIMLSLVSMMDVAGVVVVCYDVVTVGCVGCSCVGEVDMTVVAGVVGMRAIVVVGIYLFFFNGGGCFAVVCDVCIVVGVVDVGDVGVVVGVGYDGGIDITGVVVVVYVSERRDCITVVCYVIVYIDVGYADGVSLLMVVVLLLLAMMLQRMVQ